MKLRIFSKLTALLGLLFSSAVWAENLLSAQQWLVKMTEAQQQLNYEMTFISGSAIDVNSLRYRHWVQDDRHFAQLTTLDDTPEEIILRNNVISYFRANAQPFSLQGKAIVDYLPTLVRTNIEHLSQYYDFVDIGRYRVAERIVKGIRILPKDDFRDQYVAFIDEQTGLLLQSHLLDRDGNLLEQFRVVNLQEVSQTTEWSEYLNNTTYPPLVLDNEAVTRGQLSWSPTWLPSGFQLVKQEVRDFDLLGTEKIESQLYTDGLFSFILYRTDAVSAVPLDKVWLSDFNTIYSETFNGKEITFVGRLPISTAKRIVKDIR